MYTLCLTNFRFGVEHCRRELPHMDSAIRTSSLRKVYNSAPPAGAGRGDASAADGKRGKRGKDSKPQITALDGIDLEVAPGQIFGLLGPNGAGKSTTVGILTTRVRPTSGTAWIGPHDVWRDQTAAKLLIGVVAQRPNLDFSLTAREILLFHGAYFGLSSTGTLGARQHSAGALQAHRSSQPTRSRILRRDDAARLHRARHDA